MTPLIEVKTTLAIDQAMPDPVVKLRPQIAIAHIGGTACVRPTRTVGRGG
jgi:hypothetical protein